MDTLIKDILSYNQERGLTENQKYTIREIVISYNLRGTAAENTDGGFCIDLSKLNKDILETIYNVLYQSNIFKPNGEH